MYTGTHESLFVKQQDPHELFEKSASISRMPDDDRMWPQTTLSHLFKQLPFLTNYDISINLDRIEPEAGFAFGNAIVRTKRPQMKVVPLTEVKIPLIISDRQLQPFHVMMQGRETYPLTPERMEQLMSDPAMFAGPAKQPKMQKSLVDELYPPYQQRQGFGRTVGAGAQGINKLAQALDDRAAEDLTPRELMVIANLKKNHATDEAMRDLTGREKMMMAKTPAIIGTGAGATLGALRALKAEQSLLKGGLTGAGIGLGTAAAGQLYSELARRRRDAQRRSGMYVDSPLAHHMKRAGTLSDSAVEFLSHKVNSKTLNKFAGSDKGRIIRQKVAGLPPKEDHSPEVLSDEAALIRTYWRKK